MRARKVNGLRPTLKLRTLRDERGDRGTEYFGTEKLPRDKSQAGRPQDRGASLGIDVAKSQYFAVILDPLGQTIQPPFSFTNDATGFQHLRDRVSELGDRHLIGQWLFGFEASGGLREAAGLVPGGKRLRRGAGQLVCRQALPGDDDWLGGQERRQGLRIHYLPDAAGICGVLPPAGASGGEPGGAGADQ